MLQIFWHWFGLMRVCSISSIYFASLHRRMYLLPLADSYPFGADTIATSFKGVSPFFVSLDTPPEKHIDSAATCFPSIYSCIHFLSLGTEFGVDSSDGEISSRCVGIPTSPLELDIKFPITSQSPLTLGT